jgi:hypothetical protein
MGITAARERVLLFYRREQAEQATSGHPISDFPVESAREACHRQGSPSNIIAT